MRFACRWFLFQALSHHRCGCKWSRLVLYEWAHTVERQIWNRYLIEAKDNNHQSQQYTHNGKSGTTKPFWFNIDTKNSGWSLEVNISVVLKLTRSDGKTRICPFRHQYFHGRHRFESLQPSKRKPNQSPEGRWVQTNKDIQILSLWVPRAWRKFKCFTSSSLVSGPACSCHVWPMMRELQGRDGRSQSLIALLPVRPGLGT